MDYVGNLTLSISHVSTLIVGGFSLALGLILLEIHSICIFFTAHNEN